MVENPGPGVGALSGVGQLSVLLLKLHAKADEILYNLPGAADHNVHRLLPVLIMARSHGVLKVAVVILVVSQNTDSSLCQK